LVASGTANFSSGLKPNFSLTETMSSALRGAPWTPCVPWILEPKPIVVVSRMRVGLLVVLASAMAVAMAERSESPLATWTCSQP